MEKTGRKLSKTLKQDQEPKSEAMHRNFFKIN